MNRKRYDILGLMVDAVGFQDALQQVINSGKKRTPQYVCFANVHMTIEARNDPGFKHTVNNAGLVLADGKPIAKSFEWLHNTRQDRIAGMDFMPAIISEAAKTGLSIYLLGSTDELLSAISNKMEREHGSQLLAGFYSPPFRPLSEQEEDEVINKINQSGANLVLVALGCPRQEKWMAKNYSRVTSTLLGLGGAFSVYAGIQKRSPVWMQKAGLEWGYRLIQEPGRLFKRYLTTNSQFIYHLIVALSRKARV